MANAIAVSKAQQLDAVVRGTVTLPSGGTFPERLASLIGHPKKAAAVASRLARLTLHAASKVPTLLDCSMESLLLALTDSVKLRLEPDGVHGAIIPYKTEAQFQPMTQGLARLAFASRQLAAPIFASAVYACDFFEFEQGLVETLRHRVNLTVPLSERGEPIAAYAIARMRAGGVIFRVMGIAEIQRARASSKTASSNDSPWKKHPGEMWAKTVLKNLAKSLPRAGVFDNEEDDGEDLLDAALAHEARVFESPEEEPAPAPTLERPAAPRHTKRKNNAPARVLDAPAEPSAAEELDQGEPERVPVPAEERGAAPAPAAGAAPPPATAPSAATGSASGTASPPSGEAFDTGHLLSVLAEIRLPGDVVGMLAKKGSTEAIGSVIGPQVTTVLLRHPDVDQDRAKLAAVIERATGKKGDGVVRDLTPAELYRVVLALYPRKGA